MERKKVLKNIFVKFEVDLDEVDKFLNRFGIKIDWLLEDGIMFEYPETIMTKDYPGDLSFYDSSSGALILTLLENFGALEFLNSSEEVIFTIPTIF